MPTMLASGVRSDCSFPPRFPHSAPSKPQHSCSAVAPQAPGQGSWSARSPAVPWPAATLPLQGFGQEPPLKPCTRKQIPRKQTLSLGNWNAVGSNKQTCNVCNEDLFLPTGSTGLTIKSPRALLVPKRETLQRPCHLGFHRCPYFSAATPPPPPFSKEVFWCSLN